MLGVIYDTILWFHNPCGSVVVSGFVHIMDIFGVFPELSLWFLCSMELFVQQVVSVVVWWWQLGSRSRLLSVVVGRSCMGLPLVA